MATIDLSTPPAPPASFLDGLPRRVALTLPELRRVAELAGGAPLPFDVAEVAPDADPAGLAARLGHGRASVEASAYEEAVASLHDPDDTLRRRGLLTDEGAEPGMVGAVGLLATPRLALDIDVAAGGTQVKAWHRCAQGAVATLSTCDGIVFELAWFAAGQWADELSRVTIIPDDVTSTTSAVPAALEAAYPLVDAVGEALRHGRIDLVPVLVARDAEDATVTVDGEPLSAAAATAALSALHTESRGRLRVLAAHVGRDSTDGIGVVSWLLLADGWHSITPHRDDDGGARVLVRRVEPSGLTVELAPVLAQVSA
ncbi:MAG: hypothetical protein LT071_09210 [Nocardioides sp.]|nr:hypothetical protein [Nocardioides sp.]